MKKKRNEIVVDSELRQTPEAQHYRDEYLKHIEAHMVVRYENGITTISWDCAEYCPSPFIDERDIS